MTWWHILLLILVVYLVIGLCMTVYLKQTPYADNPVWVMILLWWLYL